MPFGNRPWPKYGLLPAGPALVALLIMGSASKSAGSPAEPTAASLAFTSKDSVVLKARALVDQGKFKEAEATLQAAANDPSGARAELNDIIQRTRYEYSLTEDELLAKVRKSIPDATRAEVSRWARESKARHRLIDGQQMFFRREPQNIYLSSPEAKARLEKAGHGKKDPAWRLTNHLAAIVAEAEKTGRNTVLPVKHRLTHTVTLHPNNPLIKTGSVVRVWLPFPQEYRQQSEVRLISASPAPARIAPSAIEGNPVSGCPQRTVYFEQIVTNSQQPLVFKEVVEYTSWAYYPQLAESLVTALPDNWDGAGLNERPPHIVFTPEIRRQVSEVVGAETNTLAKARKIFHWVSASIPWNAEDEYSIIPSLTVRGFTARRGDCGVQNSVFITMCRIAGIPARWQSGFETKPVKDDWGMHDWAEIYIAPWGWLPADASYGVQKSADPRVADFYCGHQDSYRCIINLDWGRELVPPKKSLRSEPADFQRGEVELDGHNLYFNDWEAKSEVVRSEVDLAAHE